MVDNRWPDYACFPATGEDFECYVGTVLEDLGYGVSLTAKSNDYGIDLLVVEPGTNKRIAVQAKFYNRQALDNTPVQEVVAGLAYWGASEGWVVTNAQRFSDNAINLANANGVRLLANTELNALVAQAQRRVLGGFVATRTAFNNTPVVSTVPAQAPKEYVYNYADVKRRWNCTDTFLRNQMAQGLPLYKQANGRYSITELELVAWEMALEEKREKDARNALIASVVSIIVLIAVLTVLFFFSPLASMVLGETAFSS